MPPKDILSAVTDNCVYVNSKFKMARTNISVDQSVFDEFSYQAKRQNKTLFAFANESLSAIAKISAEGGSAADLLKMWRSVSLLKQLDVITLPSDFIDELIAKHYSVDKQGLLKMFGELGSSIVGISRGPLTGKRK